MYRKLSAPLAIVLALAACEQAEPDYPVLADVSFDADARVDLVDRADVLADAVDADLADRGAAIDLAGAPEGFLLELDASALTDLDTDAGRANDYANVTAGAVAAVAAYATTAAVIAPPAVAIGIVSTGQISRIAPNVWQAEKTILVGEEELTGTFTVSWVAVGWLAEMRLTSSDGTFDDDIWFNGFLAYGGGLGWWDLYDQGKVVGVVEWIGDGTGNAQLGLAAVDGPHAGSGINWLFTAEGAARVDAVDGATGEQAWVQRNADESGEVRLADFSGGEPACWSTELMNAECAIE